jgi:hypothetical protein
MSEAEPDNFERTEKDFGKLTTLRMVAGKMYSEKIIESCGDLDTSCTANMALQHYTMLHYGACGLRMSMRPSFSVFFAWFRIISSISERQRSFPCISRCRASRTSRIL